MPPPPRHSGNPIPASPTLVSPFRGDYSPSPSHLPRHAFTSNSIPIHLSPSPQSPASVMSRSYDSTSGRESPASTAHFSFNSPMQLDVSSHLNASGQNVPPFEPTDSFFQLTDQRGTVTPEIHAKIDKGFFRADQDWTCYRRNYFSIACSYGLTQTTASRNEPDHERICLIRQGSPPVQVLGFYMCIAAKVDGEDGKAIELVQHTPKRDKGPMTQPEKKELKPNPSGNLGMCTTTAGFGAGQSLSQDYDASYLGSPQDSQHVASFERIQFKKATANNGKRRAAQQYFHIVVELFVKIYKGKNDSEYVKIAHRVSAQMVVRGRSPGHYQDERRGSSTNMGPGSGSGGDYGAHPRDSGPTGSSLGHNSLSGPHSYSARVGHGGYQTHHSAVEYSTGPASSLLSSAQPSLSSSLDHYVETLPSVDTVHAERQAHADDSSTFQCYTSASYDRSCPVSRPAVGSISLPSTTVSSSSFENPASYAAMSTIKEEPCTKGGLKTEENHRLGSGYNSLPLPLPAFEKWLNPADNYHPPRDCRSMQLDTNRSYYASATPAAW